MRLLPFKRFFTILALFLVVSCALAQAVTLNEYQIKSGFLYQFTKFIEWPQAALPAHSFTICVLGDDPFGSALDQLQEEKVKDRSVVVRRVKEGGVDGCQLLFISQSEKGRLSKIFESLKGKNILTVSDLDDFLDRGGIIHFLIKNNKIRFEINYKNARAAGIQISSKLLNLAYRVIK